MKVVLNFTRCARRDDLFLEKAALLEELARYVLAALRRESGELPVRAFVDDLRTLAALSEAGLDPEYVPWRGGEELRSRLARLRRDRLRAAPGELVLWLSPMAGPVTPSRLRRFLDGAGGEPAVSAGLVHCNANPFWTFLLSPLSFDGRYYRDRNVSGLPTFRPESAFVAPERWNERLGVREIAGSQWLPDVWREDAVLTLEDGSSAAQRPVVAEVGEERRDLPLLYALPLFDAAPETRLSFVAPPAPEEETA